jgi:dihydroneopterin aldolase
MSMPDLYDPSGHVRRVFLRDLVLTASIGIHPHEQIGPQRVCINVSLVVEDETARRGEMVGPDEMARVVDYAAVASRVRDLVKAGHVRLAETLAERIAETCLLDRRVVSACVRVEKLDVFPDAAAAGVEVVRRRSQLPLNHKQDA